MKTNPQNAFSHTVNYFLFHIISIMSMLMASSRNSAPALKTMSRDLYIETVTLHSKLSMDYESRQVLFFSFSVSMSRDKYFYLLIINRFFKVTLISTMMGATKQKNDKLNKFKRMSKNTGLTQIQLLNPRNLRHLKMYFNT